MVKDVHQCSPKTKTTSSNVLFCPQSKKSSLSKRRSNMTTSDPLQIFITYHKTQKAKSIISHIWRSTCGFLTGPSLHSCSGTSELVQQSFRHSCKSRYEQTFRASCEMNSYSLNSPQNDKTLRMTPSAQSNEKQRKHLNPKSQPE